MAQGKAINKKSFYGGEGNADIAMPPMNEIPPITTAAPDPWSQQQNASTGMAEVPDAPPKELYEKAAPESIPTYEEETVQEKAEKSSRDSWKELRSARDKAERERDELMQILKSQMQQPKQPDHYHAPEPEPDDFADLDPDALVDGKYLNQLSKKQKLHAKEVREMREELSRYKNQSSEVMAESRIKAQFPDFDKVVSRENVEILNETYPELARTLRDTTDTYAKAVSAYKVIKQFGIHKEEIVDHDRARALRNAAKPKPLASVNPQQGDSPLSKANAFANGELTPEMKEQFRREMAYSRKNH